MILPSLERWGWAVALGGVLGLWTLVVQVVQPSYLPAIPAVVVELGRGLAGDGLAGAIAATAVNWLRGFAIAAGAGIAVGVALGLIPLLAEAVAPVVNFLRTLPGIAVLPLTVLVVGLNATAISAVVAFSAVWFVLLNTIDGVRRIDAVTVETAAVYHVTGWRRVRSVIVPAALPQIVTGCKIALGLALVVCVSAELVTGIDGIGAFVARSQGALQTARAFAGILLASVAGFAAMRLATLLESRLIHWAEDGA